MFSTSIFKYLSEIQLELFIKKKKKMHLLLNNCSSSKKFTESRHKKAQLSMSTQHLRSALVTFMHSCQVSQTNWGWLRPSVLREVDGPGGEGREGKWVDNTIQGNFGYLWRKVVWLYRQLKPSVRIRLQEIRFTVSLLACKECMKRVN